MLLYFTPDTWSFIKLVLSRSIRDAGQFIGIGSIVVGQVVYGVVQAVAGIGIVTCSVHGQDVTS